MMTYEGKLTAEFIRGNLVIFQPKTADEAWHIQEALFVLGAKWVEGQTKPILLVECVKKRFFCDKGQIRYGVDKSDEAVGLLCTLENFQEDDLTAQAKTVPREEWVTKSYMEEKFNALAAKIEEQQKLIEKLLQPQTGAGIFGTGKTTIKRRHS